MSDKAVLLILLALLLNAIVLARHLSRPHDAPKPAEPFRPLGTKATVPVLTWDPADVVKDLPLQVGYAGLRWDGEEFPFITVGDVIIKIGDEQLVTAQVEIAVRLPT